MFRGPKYSALLHCTCILEINTNHCTVICIANTPRNCITAPKHFEIFIFSYHYQIKLLKFLYEVIRPSFHRCYSFDARCWLNLPRTAVYFWACLVGWQTCCWILTVQHCLKCVSTTIRNIKSFIYSTCLKKIVLFFPKKIILCPIMGDNILPFFFF